YSPWPNALRVMCQSTRCLSMQNMDYRCNPIFVTCCHVATVVSRRRQLASPAAQPRAAECEHGSNNQDPLFTSGFEFTTAQLRAPAPHELAIDSLAQDTLRPGAQLYRAHRRRPVEYGVRPPWDPWACQAMTSSTSVSSRRSSTAADRPRSRSWPTSSARRR